MYNEPNYPDDEPGRCRTDILIENRRRTDRCQMLLLYLNPLEAQPVAAGRDKETDAAKPATKTGTSNWQQAQ